MQRLLAMAVLYVWSTVAVADVPLSEDIILDLNGLQSQLAALSGAGAEDESLNAILSRARAQAARLASGNRADQWASALYHQLAASALVRQEAPEAAADELASARQRTSVPNSQRLRWLRDEASLRRAAGQRSQAIELYAQWLGESAGHERYLESVWALVRLLAEEERWEEALEWLTPQLAPGRELSDAQQALVNVVLRQAGEGEQALAWLLESLSERSSAEEWRQAAGLAQQAGLLGAAAGVWEAAWQMGKFTAPEDRLTLIRLHLAGGTPARAGEHLEAALEAGELPDDEETLRLRATAWQQARHVEHALNAWQALADTTQTADDWRQYGQLAYAWGNESLAKEALSRAAELGDEQAEQWLGYFD
ncbi:hypothetical protein [Halomonas sp. BC1]|uniref:hypothetical protein n=1 Tax=Halomonas sp. BC1 TaxID=1670448 RepID=UPI0009BC9384|nr:hypothetical protein [Halomonas sp. BC1]